MLLVLGCFPSSELRSVLNSLFVFILSALFRQASRLHRVINEDPRMDINSSKRRTDPRPRCILRSLPPSTRPMQEDCRHQTAASHSKTHGCSSLTRNQQHYFQRQHPGNIQVSRSGDQVC